MSSPRVVPPAEAIVVREDPAAPAARPDRETLGSPTTDRVDSLEQPPTAPATAPPTAPPSPILLPSEDVVAFIEQFNATYGRIGLRMQLTPEGKAALLTRDSRSKSRDEPFPP